MPSKKKPALQKATLKQTPLRPQLQSALNLSKATTRHLWQNKRLYGLLAIVYGLLNLLLVRGFASTTNVSELKSQLSALSHGFSGSVTSSLSIYAQLIGSSGSGNSDAAGAYQLFLALIMSLAIIWSLRQLLAGNEIRVRDAFYKGMYPLIPYLLVLIVVGLQLIPLVIGSTVYSAVITNGIAVHLIEKVLWAVFFIACASLTLYWLASSLMALYIATLPEMTPLLALRSARDLVRNRRLAVLRKMTFLPLLFLVTSALIMVPIIIVAAPIAQVVFFILSMLSLIVIHAYLYLLYRDLLNE